MADFDKIPDDLNELIFNWDDRSQDEIKHDISIDDETLRDGLQSPSVKNPSMREKLDIVRMMVNLGITTADIGLPGSGKEGVADLDELITNIRMEGLNLLPRVACRSHKDDLTALANLTQKHGITIYNDMFIASSKIRRFAEGWHFADVKETLKKALEFTVKEKLPTMFVLEDATRTKPEELKQLFHLALDYGVKRLCLTDTVGFATPDAARKIVRFSRSILKNAGFEKSVKLDWHGHNDRGLALACAMAAVDAGIDQVHGCALGIGERSGNTAIELLLVNLKMMGFWQHDLHKLPDYCQTVSHAVGVQIPKNWPVIGRDAFATSTGVHASAILKAHNRGQNYFADFVYSSVPASDFGFEQLIRIGFMSGKSNVIWMLNKLNIEPESELVSYVLGIAKSHRKQIDYEDLKCLVEDFKKNKKKEAKQS